MHDHFARRYTVKRLGETGADHSLKSTPDGWLDQHFDSNRGIKAAQLKFWMQATG